MVNAGFLIVRVCALVSFCLDKLSFLWFNFFYRWTYTGVPEHIHIASVCEVTYVCHTDGFTKGLLFLFGKSGSFYCDDKSVEPRCNLCPP